MTRESEFIDKCDTCGKYGAVRLKRIKKKPYNSKSKLNPKQEFKTKTEFDFRTNYPYTTNVRVNRTEHPYRHHAVLSYLFAPEVLLNKKKIVINPPKPEPKYSETAGLGRLTKAFSLLAKIAPLVMQKYPDIKAIHHEHEQKFARYFEMLGELLSSASDDRYKRSLPEWALIVKEAYKTSPRVAARKYSGITPDGREMRLSIRSIIEKMKDPKLQEFFDTYSYYETIFLMFVNIVMGVVGQDPELLAIYEQYKRCYDDDDDSRKSAKEGKGEEEQEGSESCKIYVDTPEQNHCEESQGNDGDGDSSESFRDYFYVRHYDPELRKKQRLERKRGIRTPWACDGKVDHIVDEKTIRPDIVQKIRLRYLTPSRLANNNEIMLKHEKFWLYKCLLNGMDTLDEEGRRIISGDLCNLLLDMGWPKNLVLEKFFADRLELDLRRQYKEAEDKGLKPDYTKFNYILDGELHKKFRSDWFKQMKLRLKLN